MKIKGKTLQEHIWNDMENMQDYCVWDFVILFEHFNVPIDNKNYKLWVRDLEREGKLWNNVH